MTLNKKKKTLTTLNSVIKNGSTCKVNYVRLALCMHFLNTSRHKRRTLSHDQSVFPLAPRAIYVYYVKKKKKMKKPLHDRIVQAFVYFPLCSANY